MKFIYWIIRFGSVNRRQTLDMTVTYQQNIMQEITGAMVLEKITSIKMHISIHFYWFYFSGNTAPVRKKQIQGALYVYLKRKTDKVTLVKKNLLHYDTALSCLSLLNNREIFWSFFIFLFICIFFYLCIIYLSIYISNHLFVWFNCYGFLFKPIGFKYILFHRI